MDFKLQLQYDPAATTIGDAHTAANNFVDLHYRNRDSCEVVKMYDDYYNWCLDNLDMCVGSDEGFYLRLYENGYEIFASFYDLAGIMLFENDDCNTDAQNIDEISRIMEDISSLASYVYGFDLDFDIERQQKHIRKNDYFDQINEYWNSLYSQYFMDQWIEIDLDLDNIIEPKDFDDYLYQQYEWGMPMPDWEYPEAPEMPTFEMPPVPEAPEFPKLFDNLPAYPEFPPRPKFSDFWN
jgi:hypothetical protein